MSVVAQVERMMQLGDNKSLKGTLPPAAFSNAMADLYPKGWKVSEWWKLAEWKLFLAGYTAAAQDMKHEANMLEQTAFIIKRDTE